MRQETCQVAEGVPTQRVALQQDSLGRVLVDIRARVSAGLLQKIETLGGSVVNSFAEYNAIRASIPLGAVEELAAQSGVRFCAARRARARLQAEGPDYEGDFTHQANAAPPIVRRGRLRDQSGRSLRQRGLHDQRASGGRSGGCHSPAGSERLWHGGRYRHVGDRLHTLAPGAQLFFASGGAGTASFASNIRALRSAGCDIIVDDFAYPTESPFQDDLVSEAVNAVTSGGGLYFSSAGNAGNVNQGTAGVWEGDFADGGAATALYGETGRIHSFGQINYNPIAVGMGRSGLVLVGSAGRVRQWSYDLFLLDPSGMSIDSSSTNPQTGSQDPYEFVTGGTTGERIVIVKNTGAGRFIHLDTDRGVLTFVTPGAVAGHACATNAFAVAAIDVATAGYSNAFTGGLSVNVENFQLGRSAARLFQAQRRGPHAGQFLLDRRDGPAKAGPHGGRRSDDDSARVPTVSYGTLRGSAHAARSIAALLKKL